MKPVLFAYQHMHGMYGDILAVHLEGIVAIAAKCMHNLQINRNEMKIINIEI